MVVNNAKNSVPIMNQSYLILGGIRSGKSQYGMDLACQLAKKFNSQKIFLATSDPEDISMHERIIKHKNQRGNDWQLVEIPLEIADFIKNSSQNTIILLDCLTLWLNNILPDQNSFHEYLNNLCDAITHINQNKNMHLIIISNEIGLSPHHDHKIVRKFVDMHGEMNQKLARICNKVFLITAGLPQILK